LFQNWEADTGEVSALHAGCMFGTPMIEFSDFKVQGGTRRVEGLNTPLCLLGECARVFLNVLSERFTGAFQVAQKPSKPVGDFSMAAPQCS